MRLTLRWLGVLMVALLAATLFTFSSSRTWLIAPTATRTALIMGGAGHPLATPPDRLDFVDAYAGVAVDNYIVPATGGIDQRVVVITPEARILGFGFDPFFSLHGLFGMTYDQAVAIGQQNLHRCITGSDCNYNQDASTGAPQSTDSFVVYGYSQSSTIATFEKRALAEQYPNGAGSPSVSFVLVANGNRPNGGILSRGPEGLTIPIIGLTFSGSTPTDTVYQTVDISQQYDGWSDQPTNPLNLLAELNALFGTYYLHQNYDAVDFGDAKLQDQVGDTTYYLIPTKILPLLIPLAQVPVVGLPLADTLDPVLRVMVEAGYDRTISPGQPTSWNLLYFPDPVAFSRNLIVAIPTGLDNGVEDIANVRPFGTERPGPYGVGGPPVTLDTTTDQQESQDSEFTASTVPPSSNEPEVAGGEPQNTPDTVVPATASEDQQPAVERRRLGDWPDWPAPTDTSTAVTNTPGRPLIRLPIGSHLPNLSDVPSLKGTHPSGDGPLKKVLSGLAALGKEAAKEAATATTAGPEQ